MQSTSANRIVLNTAAQALLRILIGSYFVAVSLHIIPGTDLGVLFSTVLPAPWNGALAAGMVFILAFMMMIALWTRAAALILGLMTFFASYLTMLSLGVADELASFWRDLALIAALVLTYSDHDPAERRSRNIVRRHVMPRRVAAHGEAVARADQGAGQPKPDGPRRTATLAQLGFDTTESSDPFSPVMPRLRAASVRRDRDDGPEVENIFSV